MIVEIHGGQFNNKGSLKMLDTCIDYLREQFESVTIVVDPCVGTAKERRDKNLRSLTFKRGWMGSKRFRIGFAVQKFLALLDKYCPFFPNRLYTLNKVDCLIDIAGFAYSEQWGSKPTEDFALLVEWYKRHKKKVVLLPQAFGPFKQGKMTDAMRNVTQHSDAIYARDEQSLNCLKEMSADQAPIHRAPDITLFSRRSPTPKSGANALSVGIVPNMRMLDRGGATWKDTYIRTIQLFVNKIGDRGIATEIFVHDSSGEDHRVAEMINEGLPAPSPVTTITDPWEFRSVLATQLFLLASRYHALIAALSQSVPVLALGWSHKYEQLLSDFGLDEFLVSALPSDEEAKRLITDLVDQNQILRTGIRDGLRKEKEVNAMMWDSVTEVLSR